MPNAAVVYEKNAPMKIEQVELAPLGAHELRVRVHACGVCHSDLSVLNEYFACPTPVVLGHEAAGVIEEVGSAVTGFAVGDHVVACWSPSCGSCRFCRRGRPHLCNLADDPTSAAADRMRIGDQGIAQFLGIGGFAEITTLSDNAAVKLDREMPLDKAALLGCAVLTGYGAARYAARVGDGDEVVVLGCGGVGLNVIQGARLQGAARVLAVDVDPAKLEMARAFGATHVLDGRSESLVKDIRGLTTEGAGVDFAFEAVGSPDLARTAFLSICKGGEAVLVGIAHYKDKVSFSQIAAVTQEKVVRGTTNGSANNWEAVPELVSLYRSGDLKLDELVTRRYSLAEVNEAMDDLRAGRNARGVIVFDV